MDLVGVEGDFVELGQEVLELGEPLLGLQSVPEVGEVGGGHDGDAAGQGVHYLGKTKTKKLKIEKK